MITSTTIADNYHNNHYGLTITTSTIEGLCACIGSGGGDRSTKLGGGGGDRSANGFRTDPVVIDPPNSTVVDSCLKSDDHEKLLEKRSCFVINKEDDSDGDQFCGGKSERSHGKIKNKQLAGKKSELLEVLFPYRFLGILIFLYICGLWQNEKRE
ncbi:hypothetical protein Tco_0494068 [Tanacetum coccineum]